MESTNCTYPVCCPNVHGPCLHGFHHHGYIDTTATKLPCPCSTVCAFQFHPLSFKEIKRDAAATAGCPLWLKLLESSQLAERNWLRQRPPPPLCYYTMWVFYDLYHRLPKTTDTQWRHKSKKSEKCGRQHMLRSYLRIWDWIFGRTGKAISSLGVRSPWFILRRGTSLSAARYKWLTSKMLTLKLVLSNFFGFSD